MKIKDYIVLQSGQIETSRFKKVDPTARQQGLDSTPMMKEVVVKGITDLVREKIEEGYQPYGFLNIQGEYQYSQYIQAMVKYEEVV